MAQHSRARDHPAGPFRNWPTESGFEYFYGFLAGEASQYEPNLVRNTTSVLPPKTPEQGYHLSADLADDAIGWLHRHKSFEPDKPFFMYWASGCLHGPHHVMKEWADKYAGKFDDGWDAYRERVFRRAKEAGWIPPEAQLTPRDPRMPAWDDIPEDERPFQRRLMEVAAGFAEHADVQVGRLIDEIDRLGYGDNTLVFYIWGDNAPQVKARTAPSASCSPRTAYRQRSTCTSGPGGTRRPRRARLAETDNQYHAGWAWAGSTPYKGMKLLASHLGGTRNPMAVRWPAKIQPNPAPRTQFHHCNDIVPTIDDVVGITPPRVVNGIPQDPIDGTSFAYTFDSPMRPGQLHTQYFEIMGGRAIYHDGWMASAFGPRVPWVPGLPPGIADWTPDHDQWQALPSRRGLDASPRPSRRQARQARPDEGDFRHRGGQEQRLPRRGRPLGAGVPSRAAYLHPVPRVEFHRRHHRDAGILRSRAWQPRQRRHYRRGHPGRRERCPLCPGRCGRRPHLLRPERRPVRRVQPVHRDADKIRSPQPLPNGPASIQIETEYAEAKPGGPLNITMTVNGEKFGGGQVPVSAPLLFSANECLDIGTCLGSPVSLDYYDQAPFPFNGTIRNVNVRYTS